MPLGNYLAGNNLNITNNAVFVKDTIRTKRLYLHTEQIKGRIMPQSIAQEAPSGLVNHMKTHIDKEFSRLL